MGRRILTYFLRKQALLGAPEGGQFRELAGPAGSRAVRRASQTPACRFRFPELL